MYLQISCGGEEYNKNGVSINLVSSVSDYTTRKIGYYNKNFVIDFKKLIIYYKNMTNMW